MRLLITSNGANTMVSDEDFMKTELHFVKLSEDAKSPVRAHDTDSGIDFFALQETSIKPGETAMVKTGIAVAPIVIGETDGGYNQPGGWTFGLFAWDKSGLASKGLKTGAGVIDSGYRGEIIFVVSYLPTALLWVNLIEMLGKFIKAGPLDSVARILKATMKPYVFNKGDKVGQIVVQRVELPVIKEVTELEQADRGEKGFGSTGSC